MWRTNIPFGRGDIGHVVEAIVVKKVQLWRSYRLCDVGCVGPVVEVIWAL